MSDSMLVPSPSPSRNGAPFSSDLAPRQYMEAPSNGGPPPEDEDSLLFTYWRILNRHEAVMILAGALGAIVGILITLPEAPVYQATVSIEVQGLNNEFLNMRNLSETSSTSWDPSFDIQTQVREMQSRALMEQVLKKMNSMEREALTAPIGSVSTWRKALHLENRAPSSVA